MSTEVRSTEFDLIVLEMLKVWEAGLPVPEDLLLEAVAARAKSVAKRAKDFTFPTLGRVRFLAVGHMPGTHSLSVDLPHARLLNERGFFGPLEALRNPPSVRGGPIQEDSAAEDVVPGRMIIAGICPPDRYVLYSVGYVTNAEGYEKAETVKCETRCAEVAELIRIQPAVTPMFLLRLVSDGFRTIYRRHWRLSEEADRIASAMGHQDANLMRLLEQKLPQSD